MPPSIIIVSGWSIHNKWISNRSAAAGGIAAVGASGGISPAKAYLSSFCIIAFISSIRAPLISSKVQFPSCYCCSISSVCSTGIAFKHSGLIGLFSNLRRISFAMDFGLKSVLTSLSLFRPQTRDDPDESMMAVKQGVSMMHDLYAMHVFMMHMLCNK